MFKLIYKCGQSAYTCTMGTFNSYSDAVKRRMQLLNSMVITPGSKFDIVQ